MLSYIQRAKSKQFRFCMPSLFLAVMVALSGMLIGTVSASEWRQWEFTIETVAPQKGWVGTTVDPSKWKPVPQMDIAGLLSKAPQLEYEVVAPPPQRCWTGHQPYLVPNPDGSSWGMILPYYNQYRGEQEVIIHDLGTGKTGRQVLSTGKGDSVLTREAIGFHMQPSYYSNNQLIFCVYGPVIFVVYDPAVDRSPGLPYGLRADTGEILWQKQVPVKPVTAFSSVRRHRYAFRRGPDGFIWSFFDNTLVRIEARNARIVPVGNIPGNPVQIAFASGGVYVAGGANLRRIKGLSVESSE